MNAFVETTRSDWAVRIAGAWRQSVEAVLEAGRLLKEARLALPHGSFTAMIENDLPFGARAAQRLIVITADPRLANPTHVSLLPPHWGTLYELTKLSDNEFATRLSTGGIHPEMERRELVMVEKRERRVAREAELGAFQAALPQRRYGVIYADPPWPWEDCSSEVSLDRGPSRHYPAMTLDKIKALDVGSIAADDCALFLWAVAPQLPEALDVMAAWGFLHRTGIIWAKNRISMGYWFRSRHEHLLVGTRGAPPAPAMGTQAQSVIFAPAREHSRKPDQAYEIIESYFPSLPKIELFARRARPGWDRWGAEAPKAEAAE